jgi:hypothetical protein
MHNVQQVHDFAMREAISRNGGFEIGTQGDAFECAFVSVVDAVKFALEVQVRLHTNNWPKDVLDLPGWGTVLNAEGDVMLRGPRIRIGIHLAACGEWARDTHRLTRQHIFNGPGYDIAQVISDAANGGQTVLTRAALDALLPRMRAARFPVVQSVGTFTWEGLDSPPIELFCVQPISSPQVPLRTFSEPLRKISMVGAPTELQIVHPPTARERTLKSEPGFSWIDVPTVTAPISFVAFEVKNGAAYLSDATAATLLREKFEICATQVAIRNTSPTQWPKLSECHFLANALVVVDCRLEAICLLLMLPGAELWYARSFVQFRYSFAADR